MEDDECLKLGMECCDIIVSKGSEVIAMAEQASAKHQEILAEMRRRDGVAQEDIKRLLALEETVGNENRIPLEEKAQCSSEVQRLLKVRGEVHKAIGNAEVDLALSAVSQERCAELQKSIQQLESQNNSLARRTERKSIQLRVLQSIAPIHVVSSDDSGNVQGFVAGKSDVASFSIARKPEVSMESTQDLWSKIHEVCQD